MYAQMASHRDVSQKITGINFSKLNYIFFSLIGNYQEIRRKKITPAQFAFASLHVTTAHRETLGGA